MISAEEWNARIDAFITEENEKRGRKVPVCRIYCQDDTDRSGGGIYNETVTVDTIGRFARALGDSNPLFSAPHYRGTRSTATGDDESYSRGADTLPEPFQAPPLLECCICSTFIGGKMPRLRGVSVFDAGTKWERFLPIRPGDSFTAQTENLGVREITRPGTSGPSGSADPTVSAGRLLLREHRIDLFNQRGELVSSLTARSAIKCSPPANAEESARPANTAESTRPADIAQGGRRKRNWTGFTQTWMRSLRELSAAGRKRVTGRTWRSANNYRNRLSVPMMSPMHRL